MTKDLGELWMAVLMMRTTKDLFATVRQSQADRLMRQSSFYYLFCNMHHSLYVIQTTEWYEATVYLFPSGLYHS